MCEMVNERQSVPILTGIARLDAEELRQLALKQLERKRKFYRHAITNAVVGIVMCAIWAVSEYHNASGWPSSFSQSSGQAGVWNMWVAYPVLALGLLTAIDACCTYLWRPISESDVRREMERLI